MSEVSSDPDSVSILSGIFLQFGEKSRQGDDRAKSGAGRGGRRRAGAGEGCGGERRGTSMNVEEAYRVLGIVSGASETEILAAHRRLMKMVHPDHGRLRLPGLQDQRGKGSAARSLEQYPFS